MVSLRTFHFKTESNMWNYGKWKIVVTKHPANNHLFKNSSQIKNQSGLNFNCQKNNKMLIIWSLVSCFAEFVNDRKLIHSLKALKNYISQYQYFWSVSRTFDYIFLIKNFVGF